VTRYCLFICWWWVGITTLQAQADVGIRLTYSGLFPIVASIEPGSPAALAGVPLKGAIMRIDGKEGFGMKTKDAKKYLKGVAGSEVVVIVTGINRTDTFKLIRKGKSKEKLSGQQQFCRELTDLFLQLQLDANQLKGNISAPLVWLARKKLPGLPNAYIARSTLPGTAEWGYRAVLAESVDKDDMTAINTAFEKFLPTLDACLGGWKRTVKPDLSYLTDTEHITYEKGNIIVSLGFNENNTSVANAAYSLDLRIVSLK
jgi:hypothetical protein